MRYRLQQKRDEAGGWATRYVSHVLDDLLHRIEFDKRLSGHLRVLDEHDREIARARNNRRTDGARKEIGHE